MKNVKLDLTLIGKSKAEILEILEVVSDQIRQDHELEDGLSAFESRTTGKEVSFSWEWDRTIFDDVYGNTTEGEES